MDSNNNASNKTATELDIRDVANYLLGKLWIIALVVLCFAIIAFLWTTFFVTREYKSTTDMFIINTSPNSTANGNSPSTSDWSIGKQLTRTSSELIMGDYCNWVAEKIINFDPDVDVELAKRLSERQIMEKQTTFLATFGRYFNINIDDDEAIQRQRIGSFIRSHIKVVSDDETCIVSITATTENPNLSAAVSNAVMYWFGDYINEFMQVNTIVTTISQSGALPSGPSNANATKNAAIFGVVGAVLICAILVIIFIFDDKIKTPDDVEKQLGLSVLGAIPEIDEV